MSSVYNDTRFYYEPLLGGHPIAGQNWPIAFAGKSLRFPIWVSSMTGGTSGAEVINKNLARVCGEYGFGMGLGSCRILLENPKHFDDFNCRPEMGKDVPLYANLGIAQIEQLISKGELEKIEKLVSDLQCDGLVIHINLLQEWMQEGGDRIYSKPLELVEHAMSKLNTGIIVKEVGQGMGPRSLEVLMRLPLDAIEFGAFGGTNFVKLEQLRAKVENPSKDPYILVGHTAEEMTLFSNEIRRNNSDLKCETLIISGGVRNFLDGYYFLQLSEMNSIYGQASVMLKAAADGYEVLKAHVGSEIEGLMLAKSILRLRNNE